MRTRLRLGWYLKSKKTTSHYTLQERINLRPFIQDPGYFLYVFPSQKEDRKEQPPAETQTYKHRQNPQTETLTDSSRHRDTKIHEFYRHRVTIIHKHTDWHPDRYSQRQTNILSHNTPTCPPIRLERPVDRHTNSEINSLQTLTGWKSFHYNGLPSLQCCVTKYCVTKNDKRKYEISKKNVLI